MESKCAVWGTRGTGQWLAKRANAIGYNVRFYCSSTPASQGKLIDEIPVISPEKLRELCFENEVTCVIIGAGAGPHEQEIRDRLVSEFPAEIQVISRDDLQNPYLLSKRAQLEYRWNVELQAQSEIWIQNFMKEVTYWAQNVVNPTGCDHYIYSEWSNNKDFSGIDKTSYALSNALEEDAVVLDVGSGLVSKYGNTLPNGKKIRLMQVDALAAFYNKINQKVYGQTVASCNFGLFEFMANFYEENFCDAIVISNALDHCIDPYKSLIECLYEVGS